MSTMGRRKLLKSAYYRANSCLYFSEHIAELNEIDGRQLAQGPQETLGIHFLHPSGIIEIHVITLAREMAFLHHLSLPKGRLSFPVRVLSLCCNPGSVSEFLDAKRHGPSFCLSVSPYKTELMKLASIP